MHSPLSIKHAFAYGWDTFKKQWKFLVPLFLILAIGYVGFSYLSGNKSPFPEFAGFLGLVQMALFFFVGAYLVRLSLKIHDGGHPSLKAIHLSGRDAWKYFLGRALFSLPGGLFFFLAIISVSVPSALALEGNQLLSFGYAAIFFLISVIVTIAMELVFCFWSFAFFDHKIKIIDAFKQSMKITKNHRTQIFVYFIFCLGLFLVGALPAGMGLLVVAPVILLAHVDLYRQLDAHHKKESSSPVLIKEEEISQGLKQDDTE